MGERSDRGRRWRWRRESEEMERKAVGKAAGKITKRVRKKCEKCEKWEERV